MRISVFILSVLICLSLSGFGQVDNTSNDLLQFPNKLFARIDRESANLNSELTSQTEKYLNRLAKKEAKLKRKLYKQDSLKAASLFANNSEEEYTKYIQKLKNDSSRTFSSMGPEYLPYADSMQVALAFLNKNPQLLNSAKGIPSELKNSLSQFQQLQSKLQNADQIKQFIRQRRDQIEQYLSSQAKLPAGVGDIFKDYNKQFYYYSTQVKEYRETLNDPDKMMTKALAILNKLPAYATFMKNNSFLAGLFNVPTDYESAASLEGLQTRDQVLALIQNQMVSGGSSAASAVQSSLQSAQQDISKLQNKLSSLGGGSGDIDIPNFKPQETKTKTFAQRLEYGTNFQVTHAAYFFPTTTNLGLSVGYKVSDKSTVGLGASYNIGWGSDFQHISMSNQGASIRSFVDVKAKKSFYVSGGLEYNYMPAIGETFAMLNSWQQSGLIGISKMVSMNTKVFKKTKVSLLWDFLSYQQVPKAQPIVFRVGYNF